MDYHPSLSPVFLSILFGENVIFPKNVKRHIWDVNLRLEHDLHTSVNSRVI